MQISLTTAEGSRFIFSLLPEKFNVKYAAKYQSFDIMSKGSISVPRGSDVTEVSWDGEFFGSSKKNLAGVDTANWKEPAACVKNLRNWMQKGTELTLIISGTWINIDVTVASFETVPHGKYGDVTYHITFKRVRTLKIYTTKELKIGKKKKTKARAKKKSSSKKTHTLKEGETLDCAALKHGVTWDALYSINKRTIESLAVQKGFPNSDHGMRIFAGTKLLIP